MSAEQPGVSGKQIVAMERRRFLGELPWEFIYDMENASPELVSSELITVNRELLARIPPAWRNERDLLVRWLGSGEELHLAVSESCRPREDYAMSGSLTDGDQPMPFAKLTFHDHQRALDSYIASVITTGKGRFKFSFNRALPLHHGDRKAEIPVPELVLKAFVWKGKAFLSIGERKFELEKEQIRVLRGRRMIVNLGVIDISSFPALPGSRK